MKKKLSILLVITLILTLALFIPTGADATYTSCNTLTVKKELADPTSEHDPVQVFTICIQFQKTDFDFSTLHTEVSSGVTLLYEGGGKYKAEMTKGGTVTFGGVPVGATYEITEEPLDGWDKAKFVNEHGFGCNGTGIIRDAFDNDTITVLNNYICPLETGSLKIVKVIDPESVTDYHNERFIINVQLNLEDFDFSCLLPAITKSEDASVKYMGSGLYQLNLAGDEYILFKAVPVGTTYIVTEPENKDQPKNWSATVKSDDQHGKPDIIDACGDPDIVTVTNTYTGETEPEPETGVLKISKKVDVSGAPDRAFKIFVEFYGLEGVDITAPVEPDEGTAYSYTLLLHDGEEAVFESIPYGTFYSVAEEDLSAPWSHVSGGVPQESETQISSPVTEVEIENHYYSATTDPDPDPDPYPYPEPPQTPPPAAATGSLTVSKSVSGSGASAAEKFAITVSFMPSGSVSLADIHAPAGASGSNGIYTLSLSANDGPVTFTNIPLQTAYTVTESLTTVQVDAGWVKGTDLTGFITEAGVSAVVTNSNNAQVLDARDDDSGQVAGDFEVLPQTGGISVATLIGLSGLMLITLGGTAVSVLRKKNIF